jgi:hypothetical protein
MATHRSRDNFPNPVQSTGSYINGPRARIRCDSSIMSLLGDSSRFVFSLGKIMVFLRVAAQEGIDGTESKCLAQERV